VLGNLGGNSGNAAAINNRGQVVGYSSTSYSDPTEHAFIWDNGVMLDLNTLLDASGTGWTLEYAEGINDRGQIVGNGISLSGLRHGFILTPVPEPSTWAILLIGFAGIGFMAYWRPLLPTA